MAEQQPWLTKGTALLIDDNERYRSMLTRFMQGQGFECIQANDGAEAIAHIAQHGNPDLIMCDVRMPNMNGVQFLEELKAKSISIPTIMISAVGDREIIDRCLELGAADYVEKPFQLEQVKARITRAMTKKD